MVLLQRNSRQKKGRTTIRNMDSEYDNGIDHEKEDRTIRPMMERIQPEFAIQLDGIKYALYEKVVFTPYEDSKEGQDNALLNRYIQQLTTLYQLSQEAQNGRTLWDLQAFPHELHQTIEGVLRFICDYFQHNTVSKRTPYEHYLRSNLITNEFVQHMYRRYSGEEDEHAQEEFL